MSVDDKSDDERRREERAPIVLRVDYDDADDLIADCTENLSRGGICVASSRQLPEGTEVQLVLSFPGLVEPIHIGGTVQWNRVDEEPMIGIEFFEGPARDTLAKMLDRIRAGDPKLIKRRLRVLVVEDNPHVAELIRHALGDAHNRGLGAGLAVECMTATDGREALKILGEHTFDAMIVDVYLPVLDGPSLITLARKQLPKKLPIIAVSAGGESAHRAAMAAGADIFIDKPMRLRNVIETMRSLMKLEGS
jgi:uncharacterized protein (TIGR02266 family)